MGARDDLIQTLADWAAPQAHEAAFTQRCKQAIRAAVTMAVAALVLLHPTSRSFLTPSILTATAAVAAMERTLGGTVQAAVRFTAGALAGAAIAGAVVALLPPSFIAATLATFIIAFAVSWAELTVKSRRFLVSVPVVALAQWWELADRATGALAGGAGTASQPGPGTASQMVAVMSPGAVVDIAIGVVIGSAAAVVCTLLPTPSIPTATRDASTRLSQLVLHVRCAAASLAVIFTHESAATAVTSEEDHHAGRGAIHSAHAPADAVVLVAGERFPLLRSDAADRTQAAREQVSLLAPLPAVVTWEPSQWFAAWQHRRLRCARLSPEESLRPAHPVVLGTPFQMRLRSWSALHARLLRVLQSLASAEQAIVSSSIAQLFAHQLADPLSAMCAAGLEYYRIGVDCGAQSGPYATSAQLQQLAAARQRLDACIAAFFNAYAATRRRAFAARLGLPTSPEPRTGTGSLSVSGHPSPALVTSSPDPSPAPELHAQVRVGAVAGLAGAAGRRQAAITRMPGWLKVDVLPLHAFLFFSLRFIQVVTSTVEATCRTAAAGDTEAQAGQPGACRWDAFTATAAVWSCTLGFARSAGRRMVAVMPLKRDAPRFRRALRNSLAITASGCLAVAVDRWLLGSQGYSFWAPTTVALIVARGMDAPTYSSVRERLVGSILGSVFALFAVRFSGSSGPAAGLLTSAYVALMQLPELPEGPNWARISGMTAATIIFASLGDTAQAHALLELRVLYTILGVFVYLAVTRVVFPVDARRQAHSTLRRAIGEIAQAQRRTIGLLCDFIEHEAAALTPARGSAHARAPGHPLPVPIPVLPGATAATVVQSAGLEEGDPSSSLDSATSALSKLPDLIKEAEAEPAMWKLHFRLLRPRYERISVDLQRVARNVRGLFQALLCLKTQALLLQQRRGTAASLRHGDEEGSHKAAAGLDSFSSSDLTDSQAETLRASSPSAASGYDLSSVVPASLAISQPQVASRARALELASTLQLSAGAGMPVAVIRQLALRQRSESNTPHQDVAGTTPSHHAEPEAELQLRMLRHLHAVESHVQSEYSGAHDVAHAAGTADGRSSDSVGPHGAVLPRLHPVADAPDLDTQGTDSETGVLVVAPLLTDMRAVSAALDRVYALLDALLADGSSPDGRTDSGLVVSLAQSGQAGLQALSAPRPRVSSDIVGASPIPMGSRSADGTTQPAVAVPPAGSTATDAATSTTIPAMVALPAAVELLSSCLQGLIHHWDAIVKTHAAAASASFHSSGSGSGYATASARTSSLGAVSPDAYSQPTLPVAASSPRLQLSLSNIDALAYNTAAFALSELVRAAADMAACVRGLQHARDGAAALR